MFVKKKISFYFFDDDYPFSTSESQISLSDIFPSGCTAFSFNLTTSENHLPIPFCLIKFDYYFLIVNKKDSSFCFFKLLDPNEDELVDFFYESFNLDDTEAIEHFVTEFLFLFHNVSSGDHLCMN